MIRELIDIGGTSSADKDFARPFHIFLALAILNGVCQGAALGTMVPVPWKYPLSTPRYAMIQMVGARVFKAYRLKGVLMSCANKSAPNHRTTAAMPPTAVA